MSFPTNPINGELYSNVFGTQWQFDSTRTTWNIVSQEIQGNTGIQGSTGLQGYSGDTGLQGLTGIQGIANVKIGEYTEPAFAPAFLWSQSEGALFFRVSDSSDSSSWIQIGSI